MLQCQDITRYIGSFALKDVSFSLEQGYFMGLPGKNGSGKTTLLRMLGVCLSRGVGRCVLRQRKAVYLYILLFYEKWKTGENEPFQK